MLGWFVTMVGLIRKLQKSARLPPGRLPLQSPLCPEREVPGGMAGLAEGLQCNGSFDGDCPGGCPPGRVSSEVPVGRWAWFRNVVW